MEMKNLENKEILSDDICEAIWIILQKIPNVVFGGSIALNAIGLINRRVSDIDLFFPISSSLSKNGFLTVSSHMTSDTVTDVNGKEVQRTGALIGNVKCCCFKVEDEGLNYSLHTFSRGNKIFNVRIQNVNYAIQAKLSYMKNSNNLKHKEDIDNINLLLDGIK